MDGILIIDKQKGCTSRDVVNDVCKVLHTKKVGHTGTLDPLATGVLVLCVGKATKLVELITSYEKEYIAQVVLGVDTDTGDVTGKILKEEDVYRSKEEITKALEKYKTTYMQEVPIYSAVKINGKKLYEYAREGKKIELPKREVTISAITLVGDILYQNGKTIFSFKTTVSKGTYIRSLICDIARTLGTIGTMKNLKRTKQGAFTIESAISVDHISEDMELLPVDKALSTYQKIKVNKELESKIQNGAILENDYGTDYPLFINEEGVLLALYKPYKEGFLKPFKML